MSNWIGLGIIVFILLCAVGGLHWLSKPYDVTAEEFERRAREEPGLLNAGIIGLQKVLEPQTERAIAAQQDFKQGLYDGEQESGDDNDDTKG